ncbi:E3 ubiquitin-protein ligase TRIM8-like [Notolabrus celidotus]|uniref:E3 ubiquitin-protein ligase TRIM8-like n=1 Tax=Notolabrus celidotus TaxID=1203425 RepID=UPI00148FBB84|nr:E3 ubiquitin-protein ligase TRIM8-like [Notolabrus celidotus]
MATDSSFMSEDQFQCSICLDVFTEPVSIPCGHNFCKACISQHWKDKELCKCPLCNDKFNKGLKLCVNTAFREVVENFKKQNLNSNNKSVKPGQVACDCCLGNKFKASKTCLVCLTSFCETHLEPHRNVAALKRHKLTNPVHNLENKICKKHNRILELFCRNDLMKICALCTEHSAHDTVPLAEANVDQTALMVRKKAEVQRVQQRSGRKGKRFKVQAIPKGKDKERKDEERKDEERKDEERKDEERKVFYCLLPGHMGLSEGKFCYAVELSGGGTWFLGVVSESVLKKKNLNFDPTKGSWIIMLGDNCDCTAQHKDSVPFKLMKKHERVIIWVDYDNRLVTFCDLDTGMPFFSFIGCHFNERVFLFCAKKRNGCMQRLQMTVQNITLREILLCCFGLVIFLIIFSIQDSQA